MTPAPAPSGKSKAEPDLRSAEEPCRWPHELCIVRYDGLERSQFRHVLCRLALTERRLKEADRLLGIAVQDHHSNCRCEDGKEPGDWHCDFIDALGLEEEARLYALDIQDINPDASRKSRKAKEPLASRERGSG